MKHIQWTDDWNAELKAKYGNLNYYPLTNVPHVAIDYIDRTSALLIKEIGKKPINLWVRGKSGMFLSGLLMKTITNDINIVVVHKKNDDAHFGKRNGPLPNRVNVILDDFTRSGRTLDAIYDDMKKADVEPDFLIVGDKYEDTPWNLSFKPKKLICDGSYARGEAAEKPTMVQ